LIMELIYKMAKLLIQFFAYLLEWFKFSQTFYIYYSYPRKNALNWKFAFKGAKGIFLEDAIFAELNFYAMK
jgi:hypothetical protein